MAPIDCISYIQTSNPHRACQDRRRNHACDAMPRRTFVAIRILNQQALSFAID